MEYTGEQRKSLEKAMAAEHWQCNNPGDDHDIWFEHVLDEEARPLHFAAWDDVQAWIDAKKTEGVVKMGNYSEIYMSANLEGEILGAFSIVCNDDPVSPSDIAQNGPWGSAGEPMTDPEDFAWYDCTILVKDKGGWRSAYVTSILATSPEVDGCEVLIDDCKDRLALEIRDKSKIDKLHLEFVSPRQFNMWHTTAWFGAQLKMGASVLVFDPEAKFAPALFYCDGTGTLFTESPEVGLIEHSDKALGEIAEHLAETEIKGDMGILHSLESPEMVEVAYGHECKRYRLALRESDLRLPFRPDQAIVIDTETTGLDKYSDRILQVSVVRGNGDVLFASFIHPDGVGEWPRAEQIHGITPAMVADAPRFDDVRAQIQRLVDDADLVIGYNVDFDIGFLENAGVDFSGKGVFDVMKEFAPVFGKWSERRQDWIWPKLGECAEHYMHTFRAHDAVEDAKVTLACFISLMADPEYDRELTSPAAKRAYMCIRNDAGFEELMLLTEEDLDGRLGGYAEAYGLSEEQVRLTPPPEEWCWRDVYLGEANQTFMWAPIDIFDRQGVDDFIQGEWTDATEPEHIGTMLDNDGEWNPYDDFCFSREESSPEIIGHLLLSGVNLVPEKRSVEELLRVEYHPRWFQKQEQLEEPIFEQMMAIPEPAAAEREEPDKAYICIHNKKGYEEHLILSRRDLEKRLSSWVDEASISPADARGMLDMDFDETGDFILGRADYTFWAEAIHPDDKDEVQAFIEGFYANATVPEAIEERLEDDPAYNPYDEFYFEERLSSSELVARFRELGVDFHPREKSVAELLGNVDRIAEREGWTVQWSKQSGRDYVEFFQGSPLGEDFSMGFWFDGEEDLVNKVCDYASDFDVDDHAAMWVGIRGTHGVPDSVTDLAKDASDIQGMCENLAVALSNMRSPAPATEESGRSFAPLPGGPRSAEEVLEGLFSFTEREVKNRDGSASVEHALYCGTFECSILEIEAGGSMGFTVGPAGETYGTFNEAKKYAFCLACQDNVPSELYDAALTMDMEEFLEVYETNHGNEYESMETDNFGFMGDWLADRMLDDMTQEEICHAARLFDRIEESAALHGLEFTLERNWQWAQSIEDTVCRRPGEAPLFTIPWSVARKEAVKTIRASLEPLTSDMIRNLLKLMPASRGEERVVRETERERTRRARAV